MAVNPFITSADGEPILHLPVAVQPGGGSSMNPFGGSAVATNAAGTSENVALHLAVLVTFALLGVYVLRGSGFRFVVAAGVGGAR